MELLEVQMMPEITDAIERLRNGESTSSVAESLDRAGLRAADVDDGTIRIYDYVCVAVEGGEWEVYDCSDPQIAAMEALDEEERYYTDLDRPCVISVYTAPLLLDVDGVRPGREYGWSRLLQQSEPNCTGGQHDWVVDGKDCGTWPGPNGGVTIIDRCRHCGCVRTLTTIWQYNPDGSLWENVYEYEEAR